MREPQILYEDTDILVINKPPGLAVHGGLQVRGATLVDFLLARFPEIKNVGDPSTGSGHEILRPGLVHRLDKDTSGVMVVARNQESFLRLKSIFQDRLAEKIYWAIVCGAPKERKGIVTLPIGRLVKNPLKRGAQTPKVKIRGAREAATEYRVLRTSERYALVELKPKTGRMHQLRVHMKALGHPVACDLLYGGKNVCCPQGVSRQLLHARSLSFALTEGKRMQFEADPPEDFSVALKRIL